MKKLIFLIALLSLVLPVVAGAVTNQTLGAQAVGFLPTTNVSVNLALNADNTQLAMSFVPDQNRTLSSVSIYGSAAAGTLGNIAGTANLCADAAGLPNYTTIIETVTITAGNWPAAASRVTFSGFTTALTGGTRYWIIFKNTSSVPGTDYPTLQYAGNSGLPMYVGSSSAKWGWSKVHATDAATFTTSALTNVSGLFVGYSDGGGSYAGLALNSINAAGSTTRVYSNRESGVMFTTPANVKLNVRGVAFMAAPNGTPTGLLRYRLYQGTTLVATTASIGAVANATAGSFPILYFSSTQTLEPATSYRVVLSETTQADAFTNSYSTYEYNIANDANARAVLPFGGTLQQTYTTDATGSPPTFVDVNTVICPFALILDTDGPFTAPAAAGGGGTSFGFSVN